MWLPIFLQVKQSIDFKMIWLDQNARANRLLKWFFYLKMCHSWSPLISAGAPAARTLNVDISGCFPGTLFPCHAKLTWDLLLLFWSLQPLESSSHAQKLPNLGCRVLGGLAPRLFDEKFKVVCFSKIRDTTSQHLKAWLLYSRSRFI